MSKSPIDMDYNELNNELDSLLKAEDLPCSVEYSDKRINYYKYNKCRLFISALSKFIKAILFYRRYINKRLGSLRKERFLKSFKLYFYIYKIALPDLLTQVGGKFDNKIAANYIIAAMLYDAACDVPSYRKYLRELNDYIMLRKEIKPTNKYLTLFKESTDYLQSVLGEETFNTFMNYIKIEHFCQLMSIYQLSDKLISEDNLFKITLAKGGITLMAGLYIMAPKTGKKERRAIYELGGVLQLFEDIYDIKEDLEIGILTLSNQKMINYQEMKKLYFGTVNNLIEKCNLNPNRPNSTLDILNFATGRILERRYKSYGKS
jgi:hypothetical protein